jgi:hypothetical protein
VFVVNTIQNKVRFFLVALTSKIVLELLEELLAAGSKLRSLLKEMRITKYKDKFIYSHAFIPEGVGSSKKFSLDGHSFGDVISDK